MSAEILALDGALAEDRSDRRVAAQKPWLVSPAVDLPIFVLVTLATLVPFALSRYWSVSSNYLILLAGVFNGPHLISTLTRVHFRREERFARPFHYWIVPAALIAFVALMSPISMLGPAIVRSALFYWASWHFVAQSWGILRLYQRKHGVSETPIARLEKALIFLPAFFFVLRRVFTGPWTLFGDHIFVPLLPAWLVNTVGAATVVLAAAYVYRFVEEWHRGVRHSLLRPLYLGSNAFGFLIPYVVLTEGTAGFAAAALWHAIQYLGIVWLFNRKLYGGPAPERGLLDRTLHWLSQPGRTPQYFLSMLIPGAAAYAFLVLIVPLYEFSFESALLTVWSAGTLAHYYLDGVIWKSKRYDLKPISA